MSTSAQTIPTVLYSDDFQEAEKNANPEGWIDTAIANTKPEADGLYKVRIDPTQGNKGTNLVYGTVQSSGKPEGRNPRIGTFSTLTTHEFDGEGRFEYKGRFIRTRKEARVGLSFFSSYPTEDRYYLIGLWSQPGSTNLTMQWFRSGESTPDGEGVLEGDLDSEVTPEPESWHRFYIQVDAKEDATFVRAKFWKDGSEEPEEWQIDGFDAAEDRLTGGRIGIWSAVRGEAYVDDLWAKSPIDLTAPTIEFRVDGDTLNDGQKFATDVAPEIVVTDDIDPAPSWSATLDGEPFTAGTVVTSEEIHRIEVEAIDSAGNSSSAVVSFTVDKTAPEIALVLTGTLHGTDVFSTDVVPELTVNDLTTTMITATLDDQPYEFGPIVEGAFHRLGPVIASEQKHELVVTATDEAGWSSTETIVFTIDKTAPALTILANGTSLIGGTYFGTDVTLDGAIIDDTATTLTMTLDGSDYTPGTPISIEDEHMVTASVTDAAGWTTPAGPLTFTIDKTAPVVTLLANGAPLPAGDYAFDGDVAFTYTVDDITATVVDLTLDGAAYEPGTPVTGEGSHVIEGSARDAAGQTAPVAPFSFRIDKTRPVVTISVAGEPLAEGQLFGEAITATISATDDNLGDLDILLDGEVPPVTILDETANSRTVSIEVDTEAIHTLEVVATDDAGWTSEAPPVDFTVDLTPPDVTIEHDGAPLPDGSSWNVDVIPTEEISDLTATTTSATLNGAAYSMATPITNEGSYTLEVTVTDAVGHTAVIDALRFRIDKTAPALTVDSHDANGVVAASEIVLAGAADDATAVFVDGVKATIDPVKKRWTSKAITLVEGPTAFTIRGVDEATNEATLSHTIVLDRSAPALQILSPAPASCISANDLVVRGSVSDPHIASVALTATSGVTTLQADAVVTGSEWIVTFPAIIERAWSIRVTATDVVGHASSAALGVTIDRTAPQIVITESGAPFTGTVFARAVTPNVSVADADRSATVAAQLDGAAWVSGAPIVDEGDHVLTITAADCAGNQGAPLTIAFTIDLTAPSFGSLTPANGSRVGSVPTSLNGSTDEDVERVELVDAGGATRATSVANGSFSFTNPPFAEGENRVTIAAIDAAGHRGTIDYTLTIDTSAPSVEILEGGNRIESGAVFRRAISPEIRSSDPNATLSVALNGSPFTSGTTISNDGAYTLRATATDDLGNQSAPAEVTFTIDRTGPTITITSPADGESVDADSVAVNGQVTDATSVTVNGYPATISGSGWTASVPVDLGETLIRATARDEAGNSASTAVTVNRAIAPAIVISSPANGFVTNRRTIVVEGFVVTPSSVASVVVSDGRTNSRDVVPDARGRFRITDWTLVEGPNTIRATATSAAGQSTTATVSLTVDLTAPVLDILADGAPLADEAVFPDGTELSLQLDDTTGVTSTLRIDGTTVTAPHQVLETGWHVASAVATDAAGNQARLERTFHVGVRAGAVVCRIEGLDPANGTVVNDSITGLSGRIGNAPGATVNGIPVTVVDGTFCTTVTLDQEGANPFTVRCTDQNGEPIGEAATIMLERITGAPSVTLTVPSAISYAETITANGTVSSDVAHLSINGKSAAFSNGSFSETVRLTEGLNILSAKATNGAGRSSTTTVHVEYRATAPKLSITAPVGTVVTGASTIDLSGTWSNLDPTTIRRGGATASAVRLSDTHGTWRFDDLPLSTGTNSITVTASDGPDRDATASVTVTRTTGLPSISIDTPLDQSYVTKDVTQITVRGSFTAAPGSNLQVNGVIASVTGNSFEATVPLGTLSESTPLVVRVTQPDGRGASAVVTVRKFAESPVVRETFPSDGAVGVDRGALVLVLFSQPISLDSANAVTLESSSGVSVSAQRHLDHEVLSIAPASPLAEGERYTIRVPAIVTDIAGNTLGTESIATFTVTSTAPSSVPTVDPIGTVCASAVDLTGTAPSGARVRIDSGTLTFFTNADASGAFRYTVPLSGRDGYQLARVRIVGQDGSLSPATPVCIRTSCDQFRVVSSSYDRASNVVTVDLNHSADESTTAGAISIAHEDGHTVPASTSVAGSRLTITPSEDLTAATFTLSIATSMTDTSGVPLGAPYQRTYFIGGDAPEAGEGEGVLSGEALSGSTGRPLPGAEVQPSTPVNAYSKPEEDQ